MFSSNPNSRTRFTTVPGLYRTHHGDVFLPGAGNVVFEPAFALPVIYYVGHGVPPAATLSPIQRPQVFVSQVAKVAGIGGVMAGQWINQPLNVPETTNGSQ
jgi:hypothetical protein